MSSADFLNYAPAWFTLGGMVGGALLTWVIWSLTQKYMSRKDCTAAQAALQKDCMARQTSYLQDLEKLEDNLSKTDNGLNLLEERLRSLPSAEVVAGLRAEQAALREAIRSLSSTMERLERKFDNIEDFLREHT